MFNNVFEDTLTKISDALDIPSDLYIDAVSKYEEVASWLGEEDSELSRYQPIAYPQGSFRLGTVIKPITDSNFYDVDFVCRLNLAKENTDKKFVKSAIGDRLDKHPEFSKIKKEKGRCWTLKFSDMFQMDILPTIPDQDSLPNGIWLTDKDLHHWQPSNPIDYAEWFKSRMATQFDLRIAKLAKSRGIQVEEVQEWEVKTPLQRAIQILKRHRDIYFSTNKDMKPASIIITTLGASAYDGQDTVSDTLICLVQNMDRFIKYENGKYEIRNPVCYENFADKWNEDTRKATFCQKWLADLNGEFLEAIRKGNLNKMSSLLGESLIKSASAHLKNDLLKSDGSAGLILSEVTSVPQLQDSSHCQTPSWLMANTYKVSVRGEVFYPRGKGAGKKLFDITNERTIPKKRKVKLTATTNAPPPYEIKWQVVNTGNEAYGNLRGGFYESEFKNGSNYLNARWEDTKYRGTHWVEAFVLKDGICCASSGPFYIRIRNSIF